MIDLLLFLLCLAGVFAFIGLAVPWIGAGFEAYWNWADEKLESWKKR